MVPAPPRAAPRWRRARPRARGGELGPDDPRRPCRLRAPVGASKLIRRWFPYYGAKVRAADLYPAPFFSRIIEPFCGSASYATRHGKNREVILCDLDERIAGIWRWLITVSVDELMSIPGVDCFSHIDEINVRGDSREFLRQWLAPNCTHGRNCKSKMIDAQIQAGAFWFTERHKPRFCEALSSIRDWQVICGSFSQIENQEASWFIDAPYQDGGTHYRKGAEALDFGELAQFCRTRRGEVIVCEGDGADWLPFQPLAPMKNNTRLASGFGSRARAEVVFFQRHGEPVEAWDLGSYRTPNQLPIFESSKSEILA